MAKNTFFDWKVNIAISKINNSFIVLFIIFYIIVFSFGIGCIKKTNIDKFLIPEYEHVIYNNEIDTVTAYYANRTFSTSSEGKVTESLTYRFVFYHEGRSEVSTKDTEYRIASFGAQVVRTKGLGTDEINDVYYFTEQTSDHTTSQNNYSLVTSEGTIHPSEVYTRVQYYVASETKVATNKEKLMIIPTSRDIKKMNQVFEEIVAPKNKEYDGSTADDKSTILKSVSCLNIRDKENQKVGVFQVYLIRNNNDTGYSYNFYVSADDRVKPYHVDAQLWFETENGDYSVLAGVYNVTFKYKYFSSGKYELYDETKAKYICAKVVYYDEDGNSTTQYYKQEIQRLKYSFASSNTGIDYSFVN